MNENINLYEILKDCPEGTKFWSPIYGKLSLFDIAEGNKFPIRFKDKDGIIVTFMSNGFKDKYNVECLIFPDKNQRDWSKWKCPKPKFDPKTLKAFDRVLVKRGAKDDEWTCNIFSFYDDSTEYNFMCLDDVYENCVPYNEDTKHLLGTADEVPEFYKYWED